MESGEPDRERNRFQSDQVRGRFRDMRLLAPLLPAWLVGVWLLVTAESLWSTTQPIQGSGEEMAGGWALVGTLVVGTLSYLAAPRLGRNLAVSTVSSITAGIGAANDLQESFGCIVVRVASLVALYLIVVGFLVLELRDPLGA